MAEALAFKQHKYSCWVRTDRIDTFVKKLMPLLNSY